MLLNLTDKEAVARYCETLVFFDGEVPHFTDEQLTDLAFVEAHKDEIVKLAIVETFKKIVPRDVIGDAWQMNLPYSEQFCIKKDPSQYIIDTDQMKDIFFYRSFKAHCFNDYITMFRDYAYTANMRYLEETIQKAKTNENTHQLNKDDILSPISTSYETIENLHNSVYHKSFPSTMTPQEQAKSAYQAQSGTQEVMHFENGMKIVRLTTPEALDYETACTGLSVGNGAYDSDVRKGLREIYSLRSSDNTPLVTLEVRDNAVYQCKGTHDKHRAPAKQLLPYIQQFIKQNNYEIMGDQVYTGLIHQDGQYHDLYHMPKDFVIKGNINLLDMDLTQLPDLSEVSVLGCFSCRNNARLTSLKGAPKYVGGYFTCSYCDLESFEGAPREVGGIFNASYNKRITDLKGITQKIGGDFNIYSMNIESLEGGPQEVGNDYSADKMSLKSLKGAPKKINGNFCCAEVAVSDLEGGPTEVGKEYYISSMNLTSLKGMPEHIGGRFRVYYSGYHYKYEKHAQPYQIGNLSVHTQLDNFKELYEQEKARQQAIKLNMERQRSNAISR